MPKTTAPNSHEYKYKILYFLNKLPKEDYTTVREELHKKLFIGQSTLNRYLYIRKSSTKEIPAIVLLQIAKFLKVDPMDLYDIEIPETTIEDLKKLQEKTTPNDNN